MALDDDELSRFGIRPDDERPHPHSPDLECWNESYFFDWYDATGALAGHCRIGWEPNRERVWLWLFVRAGGAWLAIEEPRLPLARLGLDTLAYEDRGLRFRYASGAPLRTGRLTVEGFARVIDGPGRGEIQAVTVDLAIEAIAAPHSRGGSRVPGNPAVPGHSAEGYDTNRYEQPIVLEGTLSVGGVAHAFVGRGERDHSWGPRVWDIEWRFLVVNGEALRLQCVQVQIPNVPQLELGYVHRDRSVEVESVRFDLRYAPDPALPVAGEVEVRTADGERLGGRLTSIAGTAIDLSHSLEPPRASTYRRALVRFEPSGGGAPALGWFEFHHLPRDEAAEGAAEG